jgi:alpha-glucan, water dikinase
MILSTVGRGGEGDVGQRIRDEILVIQVKLCCSDRTAPGFINHKKYLAYHNYIFSQRNNECKGGMMEEWHQKLHNNTSPDDVVICQVSLCVLINFI